jgi:phosphoglycolate phosphatase-like HAD superfamily hydrolase
MSSLTLEQRISDASPQVQRQVSSFLDAPAPQQQDLSMLLSEINHGTPRGQFLSRLLHLGLAASEPISQWPNFAEQNDLSTVVNVLTQSGALEKIASTGDPLAIHRLKGLPIKQQLLNYQGQPPLKSEQAAELLQMTREAVNKRRRNKQLTAVSFGRRGYQYPAWQFQEGKVLPGLKETLRALETEGEWTPLLFLCSGDPALDGDTPLERLQKGDLESVIVAAQSYGKANPT